MLKKAITITSTFLLLFAIFGPVVWAQTSSSPFSEIMKRTLEEPDLDYEFVEYGISRKDLYEKAGMPLTVDYLQLSLNFKFFLDENCNGDINQCDKKNAVVVAKMKELSLRRIDAFDEYFRLVLERLSHSQTLDGEDLRIFNTLLQAYTGRLDLIKTNIDRTSNFVTVKGLISEVDSQIVTALTVLKASVGVDNASIGQELVGDYTNIVTSLEEQIDAADGVGHEVSALRQTIEFLNQSLANANSFFESAEILFSAASKSTDPLDAADKAHEDLTKGLNELREVKIVSGILIDELDRLYENTSWQIKVKNGDR